MLPEPHYDWSNVAADPPMFKFSELPALSTYLDEVSREMDGSLASIQYFELFMTDVSQIVLFVKRFVLRLSELRK